MSLLKCRNAAYQMRFVVSLENLIADIQNILGLYQQWTDETDTKR